MTAPVATKVFIDNVPAQYIRPMDIRLSRGWEPWRFAIGVTDDRFDNLQNPVNVVIETPADSGTGASKLILEGWYITGKIRHDEYGYDLVIQDPRWAAQFKKLSVSYNVLWWSGKLDEGDSEPRLRQGSADPATNGRWSTVDAIKDALEKFGLDVDDNPDLSHEVVDLILPLNLGPSLGGGFAGVSYLEAMPILAETASLDIVCKPNGHVMIVDRSTDLTDKFAPHRVIAGRVEEKDNHWEQPSGLDVLFPKMVERRFTFVEGSTVTLPSGITVYPQGPLDDGATNHIENVIPEFDPVNLVNEHVEFYGECFSEVDYSRSRVLERIAIPGVFPWGDPTWVNAKIGAQAADNYFKFKWFEDAMQDTWRRRWRVKREALNIGEVVRPFAGLRFGRLARDGTIVAGSSIHMDYVRINRYSHYPPGKGPGQGGTIFDAIFSDNFPFRTDIAAPFDAQWMTDDVDELLFEVLPRTRNKLQRDYWPGQLAGAVQYGDIADIARGDKIELMEGSVKFNANFQMMIHYHGLQIADLDSSEDQQRMYRVKFDDLFPQGEGPRLEIKASDITANYAYNVGLPLPSSLLNSNDLDEAARYIKQQIERSYTPGKHGSLSFASVQPVVDGVQTNGNIYDTVIQIGYDQEFTCTVTYLVLPEIPQVETSSVVRNAMPARLIEGR